MSAQKVLIATGITGGHFFPAVRFAEKYLEEHPDSEITFVLGRTVSTVVVSKYLGRFQVKHIPVDPFPVSFSFKLLSFLINYPRSLFRTWSFLKELKPTVLVSFGSYSSFPSVLAAWVSGIPIVVHEQNKISGWANRASAVFARFVAVSFPDTLGHLPARKVRYLGYPLRSEIRRSVALNSGKDIGGKSRILVLGGSQGSQRLNQAVLEFFSSLSSEEKKRFAVIHIAGDKELESVKNRYVALHIENEVSAFSEQIGELYRRSTLVIARAGAGTIFELAAFGLPGILIPYPHAYAHQSLNARCLYKSRACLMIEEKELNAERLKLEVTTLLSDQNFYQMLSNNVKRFDVLDSEKNLVNLVKEAAQNSAFTKYGS